MNNRGAKAQPQQRPRSASRRGTSFEAWENVNDNARPLDLRRTKSSVRYKSASRDSSNQRMRGDVPLKRTQSTPHPPRAISAGRMRSNNGPQKEDPDVVTQQILDLREQRERRKESPMRLKKTMSMSSQSKRPKTPTSKRPSSPGRALHAVGSNMSQDEIQAEERLKRAENKISGLLQELEDLRFFDEIEASPAPGRNGIPTAIRAVSPARGGRLPPPPPPPKASKAQGGGIETYKPLSPRTIGKLDRNSLELECQTLVRKLELIDQDRQSQRAMIEMYEISMQEYDVDKKKSKKLEGELKKVSIELKRQLLNIQKGKESLVLDYEDKLQNNVKKLHRSQERADSYKMDLNSAIADAERWKKDAQRLHADFEAKKKIAGELKEKSSALEMQLKETQSLNTSLVKKVEKKKAEVSKLQEGLSQAEKALEDSIEERNKVGSQIKSLENDLVIEKKKNVGLETECANIQNTVMDQIETLRAASNKEKDQAALVSELKRQIETLKKETVLKFEEGKKATRIQETRRLQELIAGRAKETEEYERRIKSMQEQLRHQSDRHHAEIEETRKRNDENLELMREEVAEDIRLREGDRVAQLQSELSGLKRAGEQMKSEYSSRLKESQQRLRELTSEFQRQDEARQDELDKMQNQLEILVHENSQKDDELSLLRDELQDVKIDANNDITSLKSLHESEMTEIKQLLEEEKISLENTKAELGKEIDALKASKSKIEEKRKAEADDLLQQIDEAQEKLAQAQSIAKDNRAMKKRMEDLQLNFESVQMELEAEKAHHEETESDTRVQLAKLEGRLRASESNLKAKRAQIHELEDQLEASTANHSKFGEEKESTIKLLSTQLEETTSWLEKEQASTKEKDAVVVQLQEEVSSLEEKLSVMSRLEDTVKAMKKKASSIENESKQKDREVRELSDLYEEIKAKLFEAENYIDNLETERIRKDTELANLRTDYGDLSALLEENLTKSSKKDEAKEKELSESKGVLQSKITSLQTALLETKSDKAKLKAEFSKLKTKHQVVAEELDALKKSKKAEGIESGHVRDKVQRYTRTIANLESQVEEESQSRVQIEDRLSSARAELEDKQKQTQGLIQSHTKNVKKLESDLKQSKLEKEELKIRLEQTTKDLEQKRGELKETMAKLAKVSSNFAQFESTKQEQEEFREISETARSELEKKDMQLDEMKRKIPELLADLDKMTRERDQLKDISTKYEGELSDEKGRMRQFEMEKIELDTKVEALSRSKDDLRSKITELTSRLERKEREVREVTDRYRMYVTELESKLDEDTEAKHELKSEIDKLKNESTEASELRERVFNLEREAENHRSELRDASLKAKEAQKVVEGKLEAAKRAKEATDEALKKLNTEKSEVINALEGVINEVQNREDEIEALTEILERRDEELQHAKIIATKALASAKDIQNRYKQKDQDRQSDMMERIDELNDNIEVLTRENDSNQRKISMLERDVRDRNLECRRLRDQLKQIDGRQFRDDATAYSKYSASPSRTYSIRNEEVEMKSESFSPSNSTGRLLGEAAFNKVEDPGFERQNSDESDDLDTSTIGSTDNNFEHEGKEDFKEDYESIKERRSIERDALRKYVQQRFAGR